VSISFTPPAYVLDVSVHADTLSYYISPYAPETLKAAVAARFVAVNGEHPMTSEDDAYVSEWFVPLDELAARAGVASTEIRRLMLSNRLPLPSYIGSGGTQFVARDLLELPQRAGGFERLPQWFAAQFDEPAKAIAEWDAYLAGQYVCLRAVEPEYMKRKDELVETIEAQISSPQPGSEVWLEQLHRWVDELDALEPPFAPYDRLRFGGPVSRERLIDDVRANFPRLPSRR
jgi:hypothetical protein